MSTRAPSNWLSRLADFLKGVITTQEEPIYEPRGNLQSLQDKLGYAFGESDLLRQAITHKSYAHESDNDASFHNESMEFLGDAILGFLITDLIYHDFPNVSEGRLSKIKAYLVSSATLSVLAQKIDIPRHLRLGKGEEKTGGRKKKALSANAFEAVIAAVYLDAGIDAVRTFLEPLFAPIMEDIRAGYAVVEDPKTTLQEYLQARGMSPARYIVTAESGPEHRKIFYVELFIGERKVATASGTTKKNAEIQSAQVALKQLRREE